MKIIDEQLDKYKELISSKKRLEEYLDSFNNIEEEPIKEEIIKEDNTIKTLDIDVTDYIKVIKSGSTVDDIKYLLDKENIKNRNNIINRLLILINKEILENKDLLMYEEDMDIRDDLNNLEFIYEELLDYRDYVDVEDVTDNYNMNVVFLMYNEDKSYIERDLEDIREEYYNDFYSLLESIKNGTFKQIKKFANVRRDLYSFTEVKKYQTRIFFTKLDNNTILICGAMVKKVDSSKHYFDYLVNRTKSLNNIDLNSIKECLNNREFINNEEDIYNRIISNLKENARGL